MHAQSWLDFLSEIENLQIFSLCKDFDELSLEDKTGPSSSSSSSTSLVQPSSYGATIHRFLRSKTNSQWSHSISELLRAPFIEVPRNLMESSSFKSYDICMGFGLRFSPGHFDEFILHNLKLPVTWERLSFLSNSLGLSYNSRPIADQFLGHSCSIAGLRGFLNQEYRNILVEVISYYNGMYGRFLVLVSLGIGCTVWYGFTPGTADIHPANSGLFAIFDSYDPFFKMDYYAPYFHRISFVEKKDVSESVMSALKNEHPFAEITIPASGNVLKSVGLGVMVAFFLAVGLVPNLSGEINGTVIA